jgi:DNA invertase Pin-like site-specific DNA recombinase
MAEQIQQCKELGIRKGYQLVEDQVYEEVASRASADRPMLLAALKTAEEGKFDVLLIRNFERLARKQELLVTLIARFEEAAVGVESVAEPFAYTDFMEFVTSIKKEMSERERANGLKEMRRKKPTAQEIQQPSMKLS